MGSMVEVIEGEEGGLDQKVKITRGQSVDPKRDFWL